MKESRRGPIGSQTQRDHRGRQAVFMKNGYEGTSMEEIAVKAVVSKQTVYKHFADKEQLFSEIILATTSQVDRIVGLIAGPMVETRALKKDLILLGRQFVAALMDPQLLRLRRLVIANADRMPELGRTWYEQGFERVLSTLASSFSALSKRHLLDPGRSAHRRPPLCWLVPLDSSESGDVYGERAALYESRVGALRRRGCESVLGSLRCQIHGCRQGSRLKSAATGTVLHELLPVH